MKFHGMYGSEVTLKLFAFLNLGFALIQLGRIFIAIEYFWGKSFHLTMLFLVHAYINMLILSHEQQPRHSIIAYPGYSSSFTDFSLGWTTFVHFN